jgi:hypothetical protein
MKTVKNHGGRREGAGRPPKYARARASGGERQYANAEAFLEAVVAGVEPADPVRVQAAKALLAYQAPKKRAPVKSPSRADLARRGELAAETAVVEDFERKATAIRARHKRKSPCPQ